MRHWLEKLILWIPVVIALGGWEFVARSSRKVAFLAGQPSMIAKLLYLELLEGRVIQDTAITVGSALAGLCIGGALGFVSGTLVATNRVLDRAMAPIVNLLTVIPLFAAGPLIVLLAGQGLASKIVLSSTSVGFFAIALTYQHVRLTPTPLIEGVFAHARSRLAVIRYVLLPYAGLRLTTNLRLLFGVAVTGVVIGEFLGASRGIGRYIVVAEGLFDVNRIWVGITLLCLCSILFGLCLARLEALARRRLGKE